MSDRSTTILGFHGGATLLKIASTYPTLQEVILEMIQNSIDGEATWIWVTLNLKALTNAVRDNGMGISQAKFEEAIHLVGQSQKKGNKLGRFGLGLVCPLGKCERYTVTSTPKGSDHGYTEWVFETAAIAEQREVHIPSRNRTDLRFGGQTRSGVVAWRTEARMERITTDRFITKVTMDSLCDEILSKYNAAMKRNGVVVVVTIVDADGNREGREVHSRDFTGVPFPVETVSNREGGTTTFKMFLARSTAGKRAGKVVVGEVDNDFRIPFGTFIQSIPAGIKFSREVVEALSSGIFEGEILSSRARLHQNRRGFEVNDTLVGFCLAVDEWFQKTGSTHFKEASAARKEEKYQLLGARSMAVVEALAKSKVGEGLMKLIRSFKMGSAGEGHAQGSGKTDDRTAISARHATEKGESEQGRGKDNSDKERKDRAPFVVLGPGGKHRKLVKSGSMGLSFAHEPLPGDKLWELDTTLGILTFNTRHPTWVECEEHSDRSMMRFQEYLAIQALTIESLVDEQWRAMTELMVTEAAPAYAFAIIHGDIISGRIPTPPKRVAASPKKKSPALALSSRK